MARGRAPDLPRAPRPASARPTPCSTRAAVAPSAGTDVVVGLVETHGRASTADAGRRPRGRPAPDRSSTAARRSRRWTSTRSSPARPRSRSSTSSRTPTSRARGNEKRWQDVEELLDAGHRRDLDGEHPAPRVAERRRRADHRGQASRRRSPTRSCGAAEQVELVDMTPEALRRRMAHGNIYPPSGSTPRSANYFRPATSPRCASSRCCGSPTGSRRPSSSTCEDHGITGTVGDARAGRRRAHRRARRRRARSGAPRAWPARPRATSSASTSADATGSREPVARAARAHRRSSLEELGGTYHEVAGSDVGEALVERRAGRATRPRSCSARAAGRGGRTWCGLGHQPGARARPGRSTCT